MKTAPSCPQFRRAYTLIEALVASSILMVGVAAAASMSLSFVTMEEIHERAVKASNHLGNAARLHQLGLDGPDILSLLPGQDIVASLDFTQRDLGVAGLGTVPAHTVALTYHSTAATEASGPLRWTGGDKDTTRTIRVEVIRALTHLDSPLPRAVHFAP